MLCTMRSGELPACQPENGSDTLPAHYVLMTAPAVGSHMTCARSQPNFIAPILEKYGAPE